MYCSDKANKNKSNSYRWCNPAPQSFCSHHPTIYINGKRAKSRNWKQSREEHRNMAFKFARTAQHLLQSLPDDMTLAKGCLKMPFATLGQWQKAIAAFHRYRLRFCKSTGFTVQIIAKQHITLDRSGDDEVHFDIIAYHNIPRSERWVMEKVLGFWKQAAKQAGCTSTVHSSLTTIEDRSPENLERITDYAFKYAGSGKHNKNFIRRFPLPATRLQVVWQSREFFGSKPAAVVVRYYLNGQYQEKSRTLSAFEKTWRDWIVSVAGDNPPEITTLDYREQQAVTAMAEVFFDVAETSTFHKSIDTSSTQQSTLLAADTLQNKASEATYQQTPISTPCNRDSLLSGNARTVFEKYTIQPEYRDGIETGLYRIAPAQSDSPLWLGKNGSPYLLNRDDCKRLAMLAGWMCPPR